MPKDKQKSTSTKFKCANCGQPAEPDLEQHYKKVHQKECGVIIRGEKITVRRGVDGMWQCPECHSKHPGSPKNLQDHVRNIHHNKQSTKKLVKSESGQPSRDTPDDPVSPPPNIAPDVLSYPALDNIKFEPQDMEIFQKLSSSPPARFLRIPPTTNTTAPSRSTQAAAHVPLHPLPPALDAFLLSLRIPLQHLADVFIENGFETEEALDLLCETSPDEWADMKTNILTRGKLSGWIAVQTGLKQRASRLSANAQG